MAECPITLIEEAWCSHCTGAVLPEEHPDYRHPIGGESKKRAKAEIDRMVDFATKDRRRRHRKEPRR